MALEGSQPSQIYFYLFLFFGTSRSIFLESSWNLNSKMQSTRQKILFYFCDHNRYISSRHTVVVAILALSLLVWPQLCSLKEQEWFVVVFLYYIISCWDFIIFIIYLYTLMIWLWLNLLKLKYTLILLAIYRISANSFFPWIVSPFKSFRGNY